MKTTILIILMSIGIQSFSQSTFSKRKYRKGMFTEKRHHIKMNDITVNQDVAKETTLEKTTHEECPDVSIPGNLPDNRLTLEGPMPGEKQMVRHIIVFESPVHDAYTHIPKHNTTSIDSTPYTSMSAIPVHVKIKSNVIRASEYKSLSKVRKSAYYRKPFSLKESWFLYSLILGMFLLVALSEGIIAALVVLVYATSLIFVLCLAFMGLLKLLFPSMKIF